MLGFWRNNWRSIFDVVERFCYNHLYSFLGRCDSWSHSGKFFVWIGPLAIVTRSQWPSLPTDNWSKFLLLWQKLEMAKKYPFKSAKYFCHLKKGNFFDIWTPCVNLSKLRDKHCWSEFQWKWYFVTKIVLTYCEKKLF